MGAVEPVALSGTRKFSPSSASPADAFTNRDCLSHARCRIRATHRRRLYECGTRLAPPLDPFGGTVARSSRESSATALSGSFNFSSYTVATRTRSSSLASVPRFVHRLASSSSRISSSGVSFVSGAGWLMMLLLLLLGGGG